jgi:hypothetical protein
MLPKTREVKVGKIDNLTEYEQPLVFTTTWKGRLEQPPASVRQKDNEALRKYYAQFESKDQESVVPEVKPVAEAAAGN